MFTYLNTSQTLTLSPNIQKLKKDKKAKVFIFKKRNEILFRNTLTQTEKKKFKAIKKILFLRHFKESIRKKDTT